MLLRQLRETMAEPLASQARLDKIVGLIADNMRADVCSFYVLRDDGALELFATKGLKAESVHMTTLRLGEGLGEAATLAPPRDASASPCVGRRRGVARAEEREAELDEGVAAESFGRGSSGPRRLFAGENEEGDLRRPRARERFSV